MRNKLYISSFTYLISNYILSFQRMLESRKNKQFFLFDWILGVENFCGRQVGFTYIELILVVALMIIIGTMGTAFSARFFTQNGVSNATDQLIGDFRQAQINAMMGKQNSNWGVNYSSNTITLYKGTSFAARTSAFDAIFSVNPSVSITGFSDLNFTRMTGIPGATPTITISGTGVTKTITINSQGMATR